MTRFSALASDSSDDEQLPYVFQDAQKSAGRLPTKPTDMDHDSPLSGSDEDEDIEVDEDETEEEEESDNTSEMEEDELVAAEPSKTRNHALVEDSDGEIQYEHARSQSGSPSSSDSDLEVSPQRAATTGPWAGRGRVDVQKMHVMQTSLFRMPEEAAALQAMSQPIRPRFKLSPTVSRKHSRDSIGDGRFDSQEVCSLLFHGGIPHPPFPEGFVRSRH
jgi:nuclear pore complex protein Nup98-Nup96